VLYLKAKFDIGFGQLSPDGHWMAFMSDKSGRREVYVRPFPSGEGEWIVSVASGQAARWRADGKELFFVAADGKMMAVPVNAVAGATPSFEAGVPVALFETNMLSNTANNRPVYQYDVTADGKRFLIANAGDTDAAAAAPALTVVTNWQAGANK
jgi:hypothetical protein